MGVTYGAGIALDTDDFPNYIKKAEIEKKKVAKVICPFFGCFIKTHKTTAAKFCVYHRIPSK